MTDTPKPDPKAAAGAETVDDAAKATTEAAEDAGKKGSSILQKIKNLYVHSDTGTLKKAQDAVTQTAEAAAKDGADDAAKAAAKKSAEKLTKISDKIAKGGLAKVRWGPVAATAAAVGIIGSSLAGSGNKGPGERATQIQQQREAQALEAAQGQGMGA